jgi:hypothetical protein
MYYYKLVKVVYKKAAYDDKKIISRNL